MGEMLNTLTEEDKTVIRDENKASTLLNKLKQFRYKEEGEEKERLKKHYKDYTGLNSIEEKFDFQTLLNNYRNVNDAYELDRKNDVIKALPKISSNHKKGATRMLRKLRKMMQDPSKSERVKQ